MFQMGVFEEHFIGVCARDAYYQKERGSTRNGAEWDVAFLRVCVCVRPLILQDGFANGFHRRVSGWFNPYPTNVENRVSSQ